MREISAAVVRCRHANAIEDDALLQNAQRGAVRVRQQGGRGGQCRQDEGRQCRHAKLGRPVLPRRQDGRGYPPRRRLVFGRRNRAALHRSHRQCRAQKGHRREGGTLQRHPCRSAAQHHHHARIRLGPVLLADPVCGARRRGHDRRPELPEQLPGRRDFRWGSRLGPRAPRDGVRARNRGVRAAPDGQDQARHPHQSEQSHDGRVLAQVARAACRVHHQARLARHR